jgi:plastocyanin
MTIYRFILCLFCMLLTAACNDENLKTYEVEIKNHQFHPDKIYVQAGEKFKLIVKNLDPTVEEFESHSLNREKIIPGNGKISVFLGPLEEGKHNFFGEFHEATCQGELIVTRGENNAK